MNPFDLPIAKKASRHSFEQRSVLFERLMDVQDMQFVGGHSAQGNRIVASIAVGTTQLYEARALVCKRYAWRGYSTDELWGNQSEYEDQITATLVATDGSSVVGTLTLGFDGPSGLSVEESYPAEVQRARSGGRGVIELTKLALAEGIDTKTVLGSLLGLAYRLGHALHDQKDANIFVEVNPRHVAFYTRVLGFSVDAGERVCGRVKAPSVLLRLHASRLEEQLRVLVGQPLQSQSVSLARAA